LSPTIETISNARNPRRGGIAVDRQADERGTHGTNADPHAVGGA